jgi:Fic family protein
VLADVGYSIFFYLYKMKIQEINKLADIYLKLSKGMIDHDKYTYYAITHHSTAIEGSTLTEKQSVNLLEYGKPAALKPMQDHFMVLDYFKALQFTLNLAKEKKLLTVSLIQSMASHVKTNTGETVNTILGTYNTAKGDFRTGTVRAGNRTFPDYKKVPALVKNLCEQTNEAIKKVKTFEEKCNLAFKVHFDFISIHPFGDGNGRTSRLLMNYIQAWFNIPLSIVFKQDRIKYVEALESARNREDNSIFYRFMYDQYGKFLKSEIVQLGENKAVVTKNRSKETTGKKKVDLS